MVVLIWLQGIGGVGLPWFEVKASARTEGSWLVMMVEKQVPAGMTDGKAGQKRILRCAKDDSQKGEGYGRVLACGDAVEKQIPCGNDRQKSEGRSEFPAE